MFFLPPLPLPPYFLAKTPQTARRRSRKGPSSSALQTDPFRRAKMNGNIAKNRFRDILPFDHSSVFLRQLGGDPCSDYINANHIPVRHHHTGRVSVPILALTEHFD